MTKYELILSVCETGSFTATAELYNYTQPAVSQAVKSVEKELGIQLFKRTKNGMELMPNVDCIIEMIRRICDMEKEMHQKAMELNGLESGTLRIGVEQSIAYQWLPNVLKEFSKQYPNIQFEVSINGYQDMKEGLQNNTYDCIFTSDSGCESEFIFYPLGHDELMLVTSRKHDWH